MAQRPGLPPTEIARHPTIEIIASFDVKIIPLHRNPRLISLLVHLPLLALFKTRIPLVLHFLHVRAILWSDPAASRRLGRPLEPPRSWRKNPREQKLGAPPSSDYGNHPTPRRFLLGTHPSPAPLLLPPLIYPVWSTVAYMHTVATLTGHQNIIFRIKTRVFFFIPPP